MLRPARSLLPVMLNSQRGAEEGSRARARAAGARTARSAEADATGPCAGDCRARAGARSSGAEARPARAPPRSQAAIAAGRAGLVLAGSEEGRRADERGGQARAHEG